MKKTTLVFLFVFALLAGAEQLFAISIRPTTQTVVNPNLTTPAGAQTPGIMSPGQTSGQPSGQAPVQTYGTSATTTSGPPDIRSISPNKLVQGQPYTLSLTTANFTQGTQVNFGPGINVIGSPIVFDVVKVNVQVAADAPTGEHEITIMGALGTFKATAKVYVLPASAGAPSLMVPGAAAPPPSGGISSEGMRIVPSMRQFLAQVVTPNTWEAGRTYSVTLAGANFSEGMEVRFGDDIEVKDLKVTGPTTAQMTVVVSEKAEPAMRKAEVRGQGSQDWFTTAAAAWVTAPKKLVHAAPSGVIKLPDISAIPFKRGVIILQDPAWGWDLSTTENQAQRGIPRLNDQTLFDWKEENPGTAQWFELRVLNKNGDVLLKRNINADTYFRPDPDFLSKLYDLLYPEGSGGKAKAVSLAGHTAPAGKTAMAKKAGGEEKPLGKNEQYLKDHQGDVSVYWEVAGYRSYPKNSPTTQPAPQAAPEPASKQTGQPGKIKFKSTVGGAAAKKLAGPEDNVTLEVEVSDRWPLKMAKDKPAGMACGERKGTLTTEKAGGDPADPVKYVGNKIRLSGVFDLKECPWNVAADKTPKQVPAGQLMLDVDHYSYNNMFIDWGDGTIRKVVAYPVGDGGKLGMGVTQYPYDLKVMLNETKEEGYGWSGDFTVRVYVLPEQDAGMAYDIADANATKNSSPYYEVLSAMGGIVKGADSGTALFAALSGGAVPAAGSARGGVQAQPAPVLTPEMQAAAHAYMVYCETININIIQDTDATGPLHLDSVEITEFSGQGKPKGTSRGKVSDKAQPKADKSAKTAAQAALDTAKAGLSSEAAKSVSKALDNLAVSAAKVNPALAPKADATVTTCDPGLIATASIGYYGEGYARVTWTVKGQQLTPETIQLGPSTLRTHLKEDKSTWGDPIISYYKVTSPMLGVQDPGFYDVSVDVMVVPDPKMANVSAANARSFQQQGTKLVGQGFPSVRTKGGKAPKYGYLSPSMRATASTPPVAYMQAVEPSKVELGYSGLGGIAAALLSKPNYVKSESKTYLVVQPDPKFPCVFHFPVTKGGYFTVGGMQGKIASSGGLYTGQGTLFYKLPNGSGVDELYADIAIKGWDAPDGINVKAGEINEALTKKIDTLPGMTATLTKLAGKAGSSLDATMKVAIKDTTLKEPGIEKPHEWPSLSAPLSPDGDWYVAGQTLPKTAIGWSTFEIASSDVRVDLSRKEGDGPGGAKFVGISLGKGADLTQSFDLGSVSGKVDGWYISDGGLTGSASLKGLDSSVGEGHVHFDSVDVAAADHGLDATYKGMLIQFAWPKVKLTGQGSLGYHNGKTTELQFYGINVETTPHFDYGAVVMDISNVAFKHTLNGWGISADTEFTFRERDEEFCKTAAQLFYNVLGYAYFDDGTKAKGQPVGISTKIGNAPATVKSVDIATSDSPSLAKRVDFQFDTDLSLSKALGNSNIKIGYSIDRASMDYSSTGPIFPYFEVKSSFPEGDPVASSAIHPEFLNTGPPSALGYGPLYADDGKGVLYAMLGPEAGMPRAVSDASSGWSRPLLLAGLGNCSGNAATDTFCGSVDTSMFGMDVPIKAVFRLGYIGDDDYWMVYVKVSTTIVVYPDIAITAIHGGVGYNFNKTTYVGGNPESAAPEINNSMIYAAGITMGTADGFAFSCEGTLTVLPSDGTYRMDFADVAVFKVVLGGGFIEYGHGVFQGQVWGGLDMLGGTISLQMPQGSCGFYFSDDKWYISAGTPENPIQAHLAIADCGGYLKISNEGLIVGGRWDIVNIKYCLGFMSLRLNCYVNCALGVKPGPQFIGDFGIGGSAKGCAVCWKPCGGADVSGSVHAEIPPGTFKVCFSIDFDWPVPNFDDCFNL